MRFGEFWQHTCKHPSARLGLNGTLEAINLEIMMTIATPPFSLTIIGALHGDTTLVQNVVIYNVIRYAGRRLVRHGTWANLISVWAEKNPWVWMCGCG